MSKRPTTIKVDASSVQGEGAYIIFKRLTWGERRDYLKKYIALETPEERSKSSLQFLLDHLVDWNWVDEKGDPLPLPKNAKGEAALYEEEGNFLYKVCGDALDGKLEMSEADLKN